MLKKAAGVLLLLIAVGALGDIVVQGFFTHLLTPTIFLILAPIALLCSCVGAYLIFKEEEEPEPDEP